MVTYACLATFVTVYALGEKLVQYMVSVHEPAGVLEKKNSVQNSSTVSPCIHGIDSCHVSNQHDPTARVGDFLADSACGFGGLPRPHVASEASHARCFSASTMRRRIVLTGHVTTIHVL